MSYAVDCVLDIKARIGEGLFWDQADQALFFVDIPAGNLFRFDPVTRNFQQWSFGEPLGCLALDRDGKAIVALTSGIFRYDLMSAERTLLAHPEQDRPGNRFNDGGLDRQGRFWIGSMKMDPPAMRSGAFYRLDEDLTINRYFDQTYTTNGLSFSPDGLTMYFSDSHPDVRKIWSCLYDPATGVPGTPRLFFDTAQVAGRPDGATVDAEGGYWMAGVSGWQLLRLTPRGHIDRVIDLPVEKPSRPWFGGPNLDTLYCTSIGIGLTPGTEARQPHAGGIFAVTGLGIKGLAQPRFAG